MKIEHNGFIVEGTRMECLDFFYKELYLVEKIISYETFNRITLSDFSKEELECIERWENACVSEFNALSLLPGSGEDWGDPELNQRTIDKVRKFKKLVS